MTPRHILKLTDLTGTEIENLIARGIEFKKKGCHHNPLGGKILALIFEKESTRTRISFEVAMARLGGKTIYLSQNSTQISRGETYADTARVLSSYLNGMVLRAYRQEDLEELSSHSAIPVINGLTDMFHPCQLLADLMTITELKGDLRRARVCYMGDGNNMTHSWMEASAIMGIPLTVCCPKKYGPDESLIRKYQSAPIEYRASPKDAVRDADVIYTDTWFSMGQKVTLAKRKAFAPYQINVALLKMAAPRAVVLHCLPAHRGEEITDQVMDGSASAVFREAENRLYVQMALLEMLL